MKISKVFYLGIPLAVLFFVHTKTQVSTKEHGVSTPEFSIESVFAGEGEEQGNSECSSGQGTAFTACSGKFSAYSHGALGFFNNSLCMLNKAFTSIPESSLCHFAKSMSINPDKAALPVSVSKTFGGRTINVSVTVPTESWATTLGYDAKGVVTVNAATFMTIYWGGTADSTKGFMISGANEIGGRTNKSLLYIQWDRTVSTAQFVKVMGSDFTTSYLGSTSSGSRGGDRAIFGRATYNATTAAVTSQIVMIEGQRSGGTSSSFGCFKMFASGTKGGTMSIAKTQNSMGGTGNGVTSTDKDSTSMDGISVTDLPATANGTGTSLTSGELAALVTFDKSCNDLNTAGSTGGVFAGSDSNFALAPSEVFPN